MTKLLMFRIPKQSALNVDSFLLINKESKIFRTIHQVEVLVDVDHVELSAGKTIEVIGYLTERNTVDTRDWNDLPIIWYWGWRTTGNWAVIQQPWYRKKFHGFNPISSIGVILRTSGYTVQPTASVWFEVD